MSVLAQMTSPYSAVEAWAYDQLLAPAVAEMARTLEDDLVDKIPTGARILDVGCGGGHVLRALAERRTDIRLFGIDLSPGQVARARARTAALGKRVEITRGSALSLPFSEDSFDVVLSVASVKHWPDPHAGLSECVRVLRPGGRLFVVEADRGCRLDDARNFVQRWKIPAPLRTAALVVFRTWVAGQAFDLDEARAMLNELPLETPSVSRIPGTPGLVMDGYKARATAHN
ncbi:MAG: class I SAM-dependent methyltransferase [Deltaproteobacteria bacterium]|nr:class I SAM-dependent methyltransferase [Deltaproteobacteria bacterium]